MIFITISAAIFIFAVISHIIIYKSLIKYSIKGYITYLFVFISGLICDVYLIRALSLNSQSGMNYNLWSENLVGSSICLYILLTLTYLLFFLSPMGEESPTSKILLLMRKSQKMTETQITSYFSNYKLIRGRLKSLVDFGWIKQVDKMYSVLPKGDKIARIILIYRKLISWKTFA